MLADYHVHTHFSDDSEYLMEDVVRDAISLGLQELCFTEHVDYGIKRDPGDPRGMLWRPGDVGEAEWMPAVNPDYPRYFEEVRRLQGVYGDRITLRSGLEFGVQMETIGEYEELFPKYPLDFVLLSVHQVENKELWNQNFQRERTQKECYDRYYGELFSLVSHFPHYGTLAHMDLVNRYDKVGGYPFSAVRDAVADILKVVIATGHGIEVNTSHIRYGLPDMTPSREILHLYRDLGGQILTIGSDSHKPAHLGAHIGQTQQALKEMGFRCFCTYDKMTPIFHNL